MLWQKLLDGLTAYMTRHDVARVTDLTGTLDTTQEEHAWISS